MKNSNNKLVLIILAGIVFQLLILLFFVENNTLFWVDEHEYYKAANDLAKGLPYSTVEDTSNLYRSPGYPFFLSIVIRLVGNDIFLLRLIQISLFPTFLYALYRIGSKWKNNKVGITLSVVGIIYPFYLYVPLTLCSEAITIYIMPWIVLLMMNTKRKFCFTNIITLALMISVAIMFRPTNAFIIPISIFYILYDKKVLWKKIFPSTILIIIPLTFIFAWLYRNKTVHGQYIFTYTAFTTLIASYNEEAFWSTKTTDVPNYLIDKFNNSSNQKGLQEFYAEELKEYVKKHPFQTLLKACTQSILLWNPIPMTNTSSGIAQFKYKLLSAIPYTTFLLFGIIGFYKNRNDSFVRLLLTILFVNTFANGIFMNSVRYRLIFDFTFLIMTASIIYSWVCNRFQANKKCISRDI